MPARRTSARETARAWHASFWGFCAGYLRARFGEAWCLSPEQSLLLHAGNRTVPAQLLVRAPRGRNRVTPLLHDTSLLEVRAAIMAALEAASVRHDIGPFADFLAELVGEGAEPAEDAG